MLHHYLLHRKKTSHLPHHSARKATACTMLAERTSEPLLFFQRNALEMKYWMVDEGKMRPLEGQQKASYLA